MLIPFLHITFFHKVVLGKAFIRAKLKMDKVTFGVSCMKKWQILKRFPGTFHRAQILTLGGVLCRPILSCGKNFS